MRLAYEPSRQLHELGRAGLNCHPADYSVLVRSKEAVKEFQKAKDEFSDELHKAGKSETDVAKSDVKPAQSTVARIENQPAATEVRPDPTQAVIPGDKAHEV